MYSYSDPAGSRAPACIVLAIIDGKPWKARAIRNNNLRQHCHALARTFRSDPFTNATIRPAMRRLLRAIIDRSNLFETTHPSDFQLVPVLTRIAAYSGEWKRDPEDWQGGDGDANAHIHSFIAYLFERYPVPVFFRNSWFLKGETKCLERDCYSWVAAGRSIRTAPGIPRSITARALHLALQSPDHFTICQALRLGQLKAAGAPAGLVHEVLSSRMVTDLSNDEVWSRLIEKMSAARMRRAGDFGLVSDAMLCFFSEGKILHSRMMIGLPYSDLVKHCRSFWRKLLDTTIADGLPTKYLDLRCADLRRQLALDHFSYVEPMLPDRPWSMVEGPPGEARQWRMVELTQKQQLAAEGVAMGHCVASYWRKCKKLESAIFSLRSYKWPGLTDMRRHLTIEVDRQSRRVRQIRGKNNRYLFGTRLMGVVQWAADNRLRYP